MYCILGYEISELDNMNGRNRASCGFIFYGWQKLNTNQRVICSFVLAGHEGVVACLLLLHSHPGLINQVHSVGCADLSSLFWSGLPSQRQASPVQHKIIYGLIEKTCIDSMFDQDSIAELSE